MKMMATLTTQQYKTLSALLYQADMSLVKGTHVNERHYLKHFYNSSRVKVIENLLSELEFVDRFQSENFLKRIQFKVLNKELTLIDSSWLFECINALHTLLFFIENIENIPQPVFINLRCQCLDLWLRARPKFERDNIVFLLRHDLDDPAKNPSYMNDDSLWTA